MPDETETPASVEQPAANKIGPIETGAADTAASGSTATETPAPPPSPRTPEAIIKDILATIVARFGNPPRLKSLLAELEAAMHE